MLMLITGFALYQYSSHKLVKTAAHMMTTLVEFINQLFLRVHYIHNDIFMPSTLFVNRF
jgi:Ni,Fe-hydrogenase I cytochrome b subunit